MKTAESIIRSEGRLRNGMVLLRRIRPRIERIKGAFATEVVFEDHPSGIAISDPEREITRFEVMKAAGDCRLKPGQTVVARQSDKLAGWQWSEDNDDYILTKEQDVSNPDILFRYQIVEVEI